MTTHPYPITTVDRWREAQRVLLIRLGELTDLLMSTPAIAAVRASLPRARLTLLTSPSGAALAPHLPEVDEVWSFDAPWANGTGNGAEERAPGLAERQLVQRLASAHFDAAIIFTASGESALPAALVCRLAGIPLRLAHVRENPYRLLSDAARDADLPEQAARHEVRRQLDLVATVGCHTSDDTLRFAPLVTDLPAALVTLRHWGADPSHPWLLVHPRASSTVGRYPPADFGRAAQALWEQGRMRGLQILFVGDEAEQAAVAEARAAMEAPSVDLVGSLTLGTLAALTASAEVTLCDSSAQAHLAAALSAPVVVLHAIADPHPTPWRASLAHVLRHDATAADGRGKACGPALPGATCVVSPDELAVTASALIERAISEAQPPRLLHRGVHSQQPWPRPAVQHIA